MGDTVILGARRYAVERDWARWPDGLPRGFFSQVAVDSRGRVYLLQRGATPVAVFDADGGFVAAWGEGLIGDGHGIYCDAADRLFAAARDAHQLVVADGEGRGLRRIGGRDRPRNGAPFNRPTHASVAPDGEIYVADGYGNCSLHRFAADGRHLAT